VIVAGQAAQDGRPAHKTFVELVYERTRQSILSGEYPPGAPLRLQDLATVNEVSLIPVREALRLLEADRMVETIPNKGARVSQLSVADILDCYQTRIVLEAEALRRAFDHLTPDDVVAARRLIDKMTDRFRAADPSAYDIHRELHFLLYQASSSKWTMHCIRILWDHTERYRRIATPLHPNVEEVAAEHTQIIDAIEAGDRRGALQALRRHLQHTVKLLIDLERTTGRP
jgi:DNA-binding GntR family transcriptional regulator